MNTGDLKKTEIAKVPLAEQLSGAESSALQRYQEKAVGKAGLLSLLKYEIANILFSNLPGAPGYMLRKLFFRSLFNLAGSGLIFGRGIILRHPGRISLGHRVAIDDYVLLDASGAGQEGIEIGDGVIISRNCVIQGKTGPVRIGKRSDIGVNTVITSSNGVFLDASVLIAGNCYLGGARYNLHRLDLPVMDQGVYSKGPVHIGEGTWLGAGVIVLDGVHIGRGCVVGAGAVVTKDLPDYAIATGVPAAVRQYRDAG